MTAYSICRLLGKWYVHYNNHYRKDNMTCLALPISTQGTSLGKRKALNFLTSVVLFARGFY